MPVIEGLGRLLVPEADATYATPTQDSPAKVGHVASLIDTWQNSPMSEAFSPMGARRTQKLFVDGRIKVEGILDLAERLARVETQQRILHESLAGIERGGALNRCEEQEVNGSTLKLRLEALEEQLSRADAAREAAAPPVVEPAIPPAVEAACAQTVELGRRMEEQEVNGSALKLRLEALEEQLCRDLVVQNGSLEMLQTQLGSLHEQLPRTVAARLEERFNLELPKARQSTTQQIAREVREAVRGEYQRLVWQLAGPEPREVLTTRSPSLEKAQLEPPPKPAEPRPGA
ncbi:unnamed protein product [Durusdinium trenchii]|uniref:Uncharacterized protein n=1 Tax=Durusdinium trenchii TaxID=1381693 RepID=A0ABP0RD30_9DINO